MLVKILTSIVFVLALTLTPAFASSHVLDVPGPSLVVVETTAEAALTLEKGTHGFVVLEASPSHLVVASDGPGALVLAGPGSAEITAITARAQVVERDLFVGGTRIVARSLYGAVPIRREEDHDIDPDPKKAARPLVTLLSLDDAPVAREEDHDIDPDPKRRPVWTGDWVLVSAAIGELGPGWYFVVLGGEVSFEVHVDER